jgi:ABC-type oligopeptide transport system substrate-binding subunit
MKKISMLISVLIATLSLYAYAMPTSANDSSMGSMQPQLNQQKDECMLVAMNCGNETLSLQQTIDRLNREIKKGSAVYSPWELSKLRKKLNDAYIEQTSEISGQ